MLVCENDDLDVVAQPELARMRATCVLAVVGLITEFVSELGVGLSARDELQHLELAGREVVELGWGRRERTVDETFDQPARDGWRDQGVAARDGLHCLDELIAPGVLEQEATRARAQRLENVLVQVEGGRMQTPRSGP